MIVQIHNVNVVIFCLCNLQNLFEYKQSKIQNMFLTAVIHQDLIWFLYETYH